MARLGGGDTHDGESVGSSPLSLLGDEFMEGIKSVSLMLCDGKLERKQEERKKGRVGQVAPQFPWYGNMVPTANTYCCLSYSKCDNRKLAINNRDANLSQQGHEKAPGWIKTKTGRRKGNAQTHFAHFPWRLIIQASTF